jgi:hypothetical protein
LAITSANGQTQKDRSNARQLCFSTPAPADVIISAVKQLVVDLTAPGAAGSSLGRYKVSERRRDGSLVLVPESVDEVIAETAERPLDGDQFLEALDRLSAAASQQDG